MDAMLTKLIEQLPSAVAILIVVVVFVRYIEKRDKTENDKSAEIILALRNLTAKVADMEAAQETHGALTMDAIQDMRKRVGANRRTKDGR